MFRKFKPTYQAKSIYTIPIDFYQTYGYTHLFVDLDNTLVFDEQMEQTEQFLTWYRQLKNAQIEIIIVSNNRKKERVAQFVGVHPIPWVYFAKKQNGKIFDELVKKFKIQKKQALVIGDRLTTDIYGGNKAKIATVLTAPLSSVESPGIQTIRFFENILVRWQDNEQ